MNKTKHDLPSPRVLQLRSRSIRDWVDKRTSNYNAYSRSVLLAYIKLMQEGRQVCEEVWENVPEDVKGSVLKAIENGRTLQHQFLPYDLAHRGHTSLAQWLIEGGYTRVLQFVDYIDSVVPQEMRKSAE